MALSPGLTDGTCCSKLSRLGQTNATLCNMGATRKCCTNVLHPFGQGFTIMSENCNIIQSAILMAAYLNTMSQHEGLLPLRVMPSSSDPHITIPYQFCSLPLTLSLPRVINFKFLLQLHWNNYITQYEELGFS